jgi:hypothetical protein
MDEGKIDEEKDFLIIYRKNGKFWFHRWAYSSEVGEEEVRNRLNEWNECKNNKKTNISGELIKDSLAKEFFAYKSKSEPYQIIIDRAEKMREQIEAAREYLELALESVNCIKPNDKS